MVLSVHDKSIRNLAIGVGVAVVVAVIGLTAVLTRASGSFASSEPESGQLAGGVQTVNDATASGGKAIVFGGGTTTPTNPPTTPPPTNDTAYYVAPNGNDSAAGSAAAPWKTIQKAVNTAPSGATIRVKAGTYAPFAVSRTGLTITNAPSEKPVVKGAAGTKHVINITASNTTVSGLTVNGCVPDSSLSNSGVFIGSTTGVKVMDMVISDSHGRNSSGYVYGCYGISTIGANSFTISGNDIARNGSGINVSGGGQNAQLLNNKIHDQDAMIRNTDGGNDDFGAVGITFDTITANPGPLAQGNTIYNNIAPSRDYGTDGGAFEIYKASNVRMVSNTIYNNDNVMETGTDGSAECVNNRFTGNKASGKSAGSTIQLSVGMILRCNKNMVIADNTLGPVDSWMFDIETGGTYGAAIDGLTITNNTITQTGGAAIYAMTVNPSGRNFNFANNKFRYTNGSFAWAWTNSTIGTLAAWQTQTGLDRTSTTF